MDVLQDIQRSLDGIAEAGSLDALEAQRVALLGKNGAVTAALKALGAL
ncbi:MAG TPA: phenylalanine--tRNA ligase subunit alpha, partial [Dokdonella sp.]